MFLDLNGYLPKREPPPRKPKYAPLTSRQESILMWVLGFNLLMALLGPFCGSSVVEAVAAVLRGL